MMAVVVKTVLESHFFSPGEPPILEPVLVGIGMFTVGVRDFDPWPYVWAYFMF